MGNEFRTDRRSFLATAVTATTSALAVGAGSVVAQEPHAAKDEKEGQALPSSAASLSFDSLYDTSVGATGLKGEAADRLALRRLVDAWAHCADRRLAERQAKLFVPDGVILNYEGDPKTGEQPHEPHSTIKGRAAIEKALAVLNTFTVTLHMNGQSDAVIQGDRAIGETYCLVHQFTVANEQRKCQTLGIRYADQFVKKEGRWYFVERRLVIDFSDSRVSVP